MRRRIHLAGIVAMLGVLSTALVLYGAHSDTAKSVTTARGIDLEPATEGETPASSAQIAHALQRLEERLHNYEQDHEARLLKAIIYFKGGYPDFALEELSRLLQRAPRFHLAHLIRGDILMSHVSEVADIGQSALLNDASREQRVLLEQLRDEAEARLASHLVAVDPDTVPAPLLKLSDNIDKVVLVDKSRHRLYLYQRQGTDQAPRLVRDYYVSTGRAEGNKYRRGDLRTPEGVYFVTRYIDDEKLPEKYGVGAFPVDYPNALDRRLGKTGYGIWLHGTDRIYYSRPPLDSEGCVVLPNIDLSKIKSEIVPGVTPVIIADRVDWIPLAQWRQLRSSIEQAVEDWRRDWQSLDVERYLDNYAEDFWSGNHDLQSWRRYKQRVARHKTFQKVGLSDVSMFLYPRTAAMGREMVLVKFRQQYRSNNFNSETHKRLMLVKEDGEWRIIYEG